MISAVRQATGVERFTYVTAVTAVKGDRKLWENHESFVQQLGRNPIRLITLGDMLGELVPELSTTVTNSQLSRTLQLIKAAGCTISVANK